MIGRAPTIKYSGAAEPQGVCEPQLDPDCEISNKAILRICDSDQNARNIERMTHWILYRHYTYNRLIPEFPDESIADS